MITYSNDSDVTSKYAHLTIPVNITVEEYREEAFRLINVRIRALYSLPMDTTDENDLAYLKSIESRMAAGNILIAVASVAERENVHEYGKLLIDQAEEKLQKLIDQEIVLKAAKDTDASDDVIDPPKLQGSAADEYGTFDRVMSGIENDAIEGIVDSENYNAIEDTKE